MSESGDSTDRRSSPPASNGSRRLALGALFVVWLAFDFPAFEGKVLFPVDIATASFSSTAPEPHNPLGSDATHLYFPWRSYLGERIRSLDVPLWDPHRFAGTPYAANPQMGVWYPPNWLFAFPDTLRVYSWLAVGSRLGALLLAYWFLRVIRIHPYGAAVGAIAFVFSGFQIAWAVHPTFLASAMWLPLALGGLWLAVHGPRRRGIALASIGLAFTVLGGHVQVALYAWMAAAVWAAVLLASARRRRGREPPRPRPSLRILGPSVASCFLLAGGLASLQLLSTAELAGEIVRGDEPYEALVGAALPLRHLLTLLVPDRFGNPIDGNYAGGLNYTETAFYVGIGVLLLAVIALISRWDRRTAGFAIIGGGGLLAALGTPVYRLLYAAVPGISGTRAIGRMVILVDLAFAGLAALGIDRLLRGEVSRSRVLVMVGGLGTALAIGLLITHPPIGASYLLPRVVLAVTVLAGTTLLALVLRRGVRPDAIAISLVMLAAADLWAFGFRYFTFQEPGPIYPDVPAQEDARGAGVRPRLVRIPGAAIPPNAALVYGLHDIHGSDTFILRRTVDLLSVPQDQGEAARDRNTIDPFSPDVVRSPVFRVLGVDFVLRSEHTPSSVSLGPLPGGLPPAFLATCVEPERPHAPPNPGEVLDGRVSVAGIDTAASSTTCVLARSATVARYEPERVVIHTSSARPSILVISDAWFPGWSATIDGEPGPVLRVVEALRGVPLGPGDHLVVLTYRPGWLGIGAAATIGALLIILALLFLPGLRSGPGTTSS